MEDRTEPPEGAAPADGTAAAAAETAGPPEDVDDPRSGLSSERTELAWNRSGLAVMTLSAILLRRLWPLQGWRSDAALVGIAIGALVWAGSMRMARRRERTAGTGGVRPMGLDACRLLTAGTLLLALAGFAVSLISPT